MTTPRRAATRERLVEAAIAQFAASGIDGTSVEQLAEAAGFTRGAFYSNFATKDDLCLAIMQRQRDEIVDSLSKAFETAPAGADTQWAFEVALPQFFLGIGPTDEFRIVVLEIWLRATRSPELRAKLNEFTDETRPRIETFLAQLAEQVGLSFRADISTVMVILEAVFFQALLDELDPVPLLANAARAISEPA